MSSENTLPVAATATTTTPSTPAAPAATPRVPAVTSAIPQAKPTFAGKPGKQRKPKQNVAPATTNPTITHS